MNTRTCVLRILIWLAALTFSFSACAAEPERATLQVGVWTLWHDRAISIAPASDVVVRIRQCEHCDSTVLRKPISVRADKTALQIEGRNSRPLAFIDGNYKISAHGQTLSLSYPLRVQARDGVLILSIALPVERYVKRVVASESGPGDTPESLKALAIVVRSFALHQKHGHAEYDLCDSTHCELLHLEGSPRYAAAHAATLATAGETLWFHGARAAAWFHQSCGGRTASPSEIWPLRTNQVASAASYLNSRPDPYCSASGAREWSSQISRAEVTHSLASAGLAQTGWTTLSVVERGESGRAKFMRAGLSQFSAEDFRLAVGRSLGWNRILSTWFEVSQQGETFYFHGRGSGHGVGLCQTGAAAMGAKGRDHAAILTQYFPGAEIAEESSGQRWQTISQDGLVLETLRAEDRNFLPQLTNELNEAEHRSGMRVTTPIVVRAFPSTGAFRNATLAPGWVAAFTEGSWIGTQPLATLAARKLLASTMRHEFLHALVEEHCAQATPLWLREGMVEAWSEPRSSLARAPKITVRDLDRVLAHSSSEMESANAHHAAGWYAQKLLDRFGKSQVIAWLHEGVPASTLAAIHAGQVAP